MGNPTAQPHFIDERNSLHADYPLPDLNDPVMRPFWDGARAGKLMLQRDRRSGEVHWPPKPLYWSGGELEWFAAQGRGQIFSYVVAYPPFLPALEHLLPLVLVLVETDEGPRLVGYMVNCAPADIHFGMRVRVVFKLLTDDIALPIWEPES